MSYSLFTPTGSQYASTPLTVPDNSIDQALYDSTNKLGVQLLGRNTIDYGTAIAQNTIQMVSNFAGTVAPIPSVALQGQLWFQVTSTTTGQLYVRTAQGGTFPTGWEKIATVNSPNPSDGDVQVLSGPTRINIWANGAWQQVFPAQYS